MRLEWMLCLTLSVLTALGFARSGGQFPPDMTFITQPLLQLVPQLSGLEEPALSTPDTPILTPDASSDSRLLEIDGQPTSSSLDPTSGQLLTKQDPRLTACPGISEARGLSPQQFTAFVVLTRTGQPSRQDIEQPLGQPTCASSADPWNANVTYFLDFENRILRIQYQHGLYQSHTLQ
ncbi:hypothetical protein [Leptolyngbya sp. FACHB-261]|uniref:hypothetical protein n=1 Tax=Leptolyngbya sp. FACHB-261 TaxID=2692806 RepID=UPI0016855A9B|nr:hypothetical protein [Leptolyngbya sp. FACHB-261]MBD2099995.1 hypothetical protein [Leptolyngbya sp. FACHB-261]